VAFSNSKWAIKISKKIIFICNTKTKIKKRKKRKEYIVTQACQRFQFIFQPAAGRMPGHKF
jgi:hypothetical protein